MKNYSELCFGKYCDMKISELCSKHLKICTAPLKDYNMNFRFCIADLFHMLLNFVLDKRRRGTVEMEEAPSFLLSSYLDPCSPFPSLLLFFLSVEQVHVGVYVFVSGDGRRQERDQIIMQQKARHSTWNNYIESKAKCCHLKNWPLRDFAAGVYLSEAPLPLGFCLEWWSNFVGTESGQIQCVKLLQNMVSNRTKHPHPTHCLYILYFDTGKGKGGGGIWTREKVRWAKVHKAGWKIPKWLTESPVYKLW